jgi:(p)ppGpp synthase/HD superfamily hydrolase
LPASQWTPLLEQALRVAAAAHAGQTRKASTLPYFSHPAAVALILVRAGLDAEDILAAAILHDTVEDTSVDEASLRAQFPQEVCDIVLAASERKTDSDGRQRPWRERKTEHIDVVRRAGMETRAVILGDKLHNLHSMVADLQRGEELWSRFNAPQRDVLWYHTAIVAAAHRGLDETLPDVRLTALASECELLISQLSEPGPASD